MFEDERVLIVSQIKIVDEVFLSIDKDRTVRASIQEVYNIYNNKFELYFANGGDQNNNVCPELELCQKLGVKLIDGLGDKIQSSSWLLKK